MVDVQGKWYLSKDLIMRNQSVNKENTLPCGISKCTGSEAGPSLVCVRSRNRPEFRSDA